MITTADDPRRERRVLWTAILLSAMFHLFFFLIYFRGAELLAKAHFRIPIPMATPKEEVVMLSSALTLSKKPKPVPASKPQPQKPRPQSPESQPNPETQPQTLLPPSLPEPSRMLHELAKNAPTAPPNKPKTQKEKRVTETPTAPPTTAPHTEKRVAYLRPPQLPRHASEPSHLSQQQLEQIESDMSRTIAAARSNSNPLVVPRQTPGAPKHYQIQMSGVAGDLRGYEGVCDPIKTWYQGSFDYYYVTCNVQAMDGSLQRQAMPWPIHYPASRDPFNGSMTPEQVERLNHEVGVPGPDPGWRLPPGQTTTREMRDYAHRHGVEI
jgi:hypothetical protein